MALLYRFNYKIQLLTVLSIVLLILNASGQEEYKYFRTGVDGEAEVTLFNVNTADLMDRGSAFVNSSFIKGAVSVSDYSGNMTVGHSMAINYPNDLKTSLTLIFNSNTSHAYFEDFVGRFNTTINDGFDVDWIYSGNTVRENSVNAACWVFGINGIALQTTNFEKNFFLGSKDDPELEPAAYYFTGTQVPLLATGYHYTNDVSFPWNNRERELLEDTTAADYIPNVTVADKIRIMTSEGSFITLVNPNSRSNYHPYDSESWDDHLTGLYFNSDEKSNGYAIVKWEDETNGIYKERKIWYKPGDGLTYYFEEEYASYQNLDVLTEWGDRRTNQPKIAYLRNIQSQNGDSIVFSYDYQNIFGTTVNHGRKFLKNIQFYKNVTIPVDGSDIEFTYEKDGTTYNINIENRLADESYTLVLQNYNSDFDNNFNQIVRDTTELKTNIMQIGSITNNKNANKKVLYDYDNHTRKYTYGAMEPANWDEYIRTGDPTIPPVFFENYYYLKYTTKIMTHREVFKGEKNDFIYWVDYQLDNSTPLYDANLSYNIIDESWWDHWQQGVVEPLEYQENWGYYINTYLNKPNYSFRIYRYFMTDYFWQLYLPGYHLGNMNYAVRDNYTSAMIKSITNSIYNDTEDEFYAISKKDYSYTWDKTLYWGDDGEFNPRDPEHRLDYLSLPFNTSNTQQYNDLSPRITNIKTTINTTNLVGDQQSRESAENSYKEEKVFELIKASSKFRMNYRNTMISQDIYSETRITSDSVFDESNNHLQSVTYHYHNNAQASTQYSNHDLFLLYYKKNNPDDLSLDYKVISYGGVEKARIYNTETTTDFDYSDYDLAVNHPDGFWADFCKITNLQDLTTTISETYCDPSNAQSVKTQKNYTNDFAITSLTNYENTDYIYRPALQTEQIIELQKGTGLFSRISRDLVHYNDTNPILYGRVDWHTAYGSTDDSPVTTTFNYNTLGSYPGYLKQIVYDNGSSVEYKYNGEINAIGTILNWNGTTNENFTQSWSEKLQSAPFQTIKHYDNKTLSTFNAFDGKTNLVFSVNENGYYSSNLYDDLGRNIKHYSPGTFDSNKSYLPFDESYGGTGSNSFVYNDNIWIPEVTSTTYLNNSGTNVQTMSKFKPDSLIYENYAIDGSTSILKLKEKLNYLGKKWYSEDGSGHKVYYYYDEFLNMKKTRFTSNESTAPAKEQSVIYNIQNYFKRIKLTDEDEHYEYNYFDLFGNIIKNEKHLGSNTLTTEYTYDDRGRLQKSTTPEYLETTYSYDEQGNISTSTSPDAGTIEYMYDKYSNLRFVKDANHAAGTYSNDVYKSAQTGGTINSSFTLNETGSVRWLLNALSGTTTIMEIKNSFNIQVLYQSTSGSPSGNLILGPGTYTYTVSGAYYFYEIEFNPIVFNYTKYDALNRPVETGGYQGSSSDFTENNAQNALFPTSDKLVRVKYYYDQEPVGNPETQNNLKGRLAKVEYMDDNTGNYNATYYSYTPEGWVLWLIHDINGLGQKKIEYEYDLQGKIHVVKYQAGETDQFYFRYIYNELGQLETIRSGAVSSNPLACHPDANYSYWPNDQVKQLVLNPGTGEQVLNYAYTNRGWLDNINAPTGVLDPLVNESANFALKLYYDNPPSGTASPHSNGNISVADYLTGPPEAHSGTNIGSKVHRYAFEYDNLSRLTDAQFWYANTTPSFVSGGSAYKLDIDEYDDTGNIVKLDRNDQSGVGALRTYHYVPGTNKLDYVQGLNNQAIGNYNYDANGNLVKDVSKNISNQSIKYNNRNLPVRIDFNDGAIIQYSYNSDGNRIFKKYSPVGYNPSGSYYIYDAQGRSLAVYDLQGNLKFYNLYGLDLIGKIYENEN